MILITNMVFYLKKLVNIPFNREFNIKEVSYIKCYYMDNNEGNIQNIIKETNIYD